jgi:hypothetical protein
VTTTEAERPEPAAPASRAVLSITHDTALDIYHADCTRCPWSEWALPGALEPWAGAAAAHERRHAPAAGEGVQVFEGVVPRADGYAALRHDLGAVGAVDVIEATGHEHRAIPPHTWTDFDGEVEFLLPPSGGPFQVWLHAAPGT